jgi:hypothetical protein
VFGVFQMQKDIAHSPSPLIRAIVIPLRPLNVQHTIRQGTNTRPLVGIYCARVRVVAYNTEEPHGGLSCSLLPWGCSGGQKECLGVLPCAEVVKEAVPLALPFTCITCLTCSALSVSQGPA